MAEFKDGMHYVDDYFIGMIFEIQDEQWGVYHLTAAQSSSVTRISLAQIIGMLDLVDLCVAVTYSGRLLTL